MTVLLLVLNPAALSLYLLLCCYVICDAVLLCAVLLCAALFNLLLTALALCRARAAVCAAVACVARWLCSVSFFLFFAERRAPKVHSMAGPLPCRGTQYYIIYLL